MADQIWSDQMCLDQIWGVIAKMSYVINVVVLLVDTVVGWAHPREI